MTLPQRDELKYPDVFGGDGEHMERSAQVGGEGDVVDGVGDRHQRFCFTVLPLEQDNTTHGCCGFYSVLESTRLGFLPRVFVVLVDLNLPTVRHVAVITAHGEHRGVGSRTAGRRVQQEGHFKNTNI